MAVTKLRRFAIAGLFALVVCALMPVNGSAQGGNYSFVNIDYPGAYQTIPEAINNNGAIVGYYLAMQFGPTHGFLYSGGVYTTIDDPEGTTFPEGINNNGVISGLIEVGPRRRTASPTRMAFSRPSTIQATRGSPAAKGSTITMKS